MSLDIFLAPFRNGKPLTFDRSLLLEAFGRNADLVESGFSRIRYSNEEGAQLYGAEEQTVAHGLSFNHFGGDQFFAGLWRLADRTNAVIFWPGRKGNAVISSEAVLTHADPEFIEPLQPIKIVTNGERLTDYMVEQLS